MTVVSLVIIRTIPEQAMTNTDDSGYYDDTGTADDYTSDEDASGDYSYVDDGTE